MKVFKAIGLMSGTSLDGVDIAACEFYLENGSWSFSLKHCITEKYTEEWISKLSGLPDSTALTFCATHSEYGHFLGRLTKSFIDSTGFKPDIIASHGHTVFHQPSKGLTVQVGSGTALAAETGIPVVFDFRTADVALGGQGAPLVPVGDRLLFADYNACLNIGGFANISMEIDGNRIAFDICPANIILNKLAGQIGLPYDENGSLARSGNTDPELLKQLNSLEYYSLPYPKSLGREWLEKEFLPLLSSYPGPVSDLLSTVTDHIAIQIRGSIKPSPLGKILVTGGGAHNKYLLERIRYRSAHEWILPSASLIDFKEAVIFAFLGVLRLTEEKNVLKSVTGSSMDHCSGILVRIK